MKEKTKTNTARGAKPATKKNTDTKKPTQPATPYKAATSFGEVKCCFCGRTIYAPLNAKIVDPFYIGTNNPAPFFGNDETKRCCDECNEKIVLPARAQNLTAKDEIVKEVSRRASLSGFAGRLRAFALMKYFETV